MLSFQGLSACSFVNLKQQNALKFYFLDWSVFIILYLKINVYIHMFSVFFISAHTSVQTNNPVIILTFPNNCGVSL